MGLAGDTAGTRALPPPLPHGSRDIWEPCSAGRALRQLGASALIRPGARGFAMSSSIASMRRRARAESAALMKPRLRGVLHAYAFFVSLGSGFITRVRFVDRLGAARLSRLHHGACGSIRGECALPSHYLSTPRRMRRLDHSMIFILIAGTYTPMGLMTLPRPLGLELLSIVWAASLAGIGFNLAWVAAPRWLAAVLSLIFGWIAVAALPRTGRPPERADAAIACPRRRGVLGRGAGLRDEAPESRTGCLRVSRGLPRAHDCGCRHALRRRRERRAPHSLSRCGSGQSARRSDVVPADVSVYR